MSTRGWLWSLLGVVSLASCAQASAANSQRFAVVELFSSEGCSSCPPADELLSALTREAEAAGRAVYTLAFHVDYWDSLGWRDPYSAPWASAQQRNYAAARVGERGPYTPQLIVNGHAECIGSHAGQARANIARALAQPSSQQLQLSARRAQAGVALHYELSEPVAGAMLLRVALVQPHAQDRVSAGENAGRWLSHVNVVRAFVTHALGAETSGSVVVRWPLELSASERMQLEVIAYVQDGASMLISAAARANFSQIDH